MAGLFEEIEGVFKKEGVEYRQIKFPYGNYTNKNYLIKLPTGMSFEDVILKIQGRGFKKPFHISKEEVYFTAPAPENKQGGFDITYTAYIVKEKYEHFFKNLDALIKTSRTARL